jgi:DNA-binding response OmpR family regulator
MSAKKILVVEDEADLRANVARFLKAECYEVLLAENGAAGVDVALAQMPDLIVCDITMPEMDGFGVLFSLRENVTTSHIPFIFLTASTRTYDREWGVELGANDYITKPFKLEQLLTAIQTRLKG